MIVYFGIILLPNVYVPITLIDKHIPASLQGIMETMIGVGSYTPSSHYYNSLSQQYGDPCHGKAFAVISSHILCYSESLQQEISQFRLVSR